MRTQLVINLVNKLEPNTVVIGDKAYYVGTLGAINETQAISCRVINGCEERDIVLAQAYPLNTKRKSQKLMNNNSWQYIRSIH